jgi:hypothetical protein
MTDKAVLVSAETDGGKTFTAWFPKKALLQKDPEPGRFSSNPDFDKTLYNVAKWFKPHGWTAQFIRMTMHNSSVSA